MNTRASLIWLICLILGIASSGPAMAQGGARPVPPPGQEKARPAIAQGRSPAISPVAQERARDGVFEITLRTPEKNKTVIDELVRDRDLDPAALYRVKTGGYLAFDESEWVDKIEFKLFEKPVTELPQYRRYSELLSEINQKIWEIKQQLDRYDLLALRMMNMCDKSKFPTLQSIDENVLQQLTVYKKLVLLRALVVNSLDRLLTERSCADRYAQYQRSLDLYARSMAELAKSTEILTKRALALSEEAPSDQNKVLSKGESKPQPQGTRAPGQ